MITSAILTASMIAMVSSALYLRYERRKLDELLESDLTIYIYLAPDCDDAPSLDVYSEEVLARKMNAQWN